MTSVGRTNIARCGRRKHSVAFTRRCWVLAAGVSQAGDDVSFLGLPLVAILRLHVSALGLSSLRLAEYLPGVVAVEVAARSSALERRSAVIASSLGQAAVLCTVVFVGSLVSIDIWALLATAVFMGIGAVVLDVSQQTALATFPPGDIEQMNANLTLATSAARAAGPSIASGIISLLSPLRALLADAASFVASGVLLAAALQSAPQARAIAMPDQVQSPRSDRRRGFTTPYRLALSQPLTKAAAPVVGLMTLAISLAETLLLLFMFDTLHLRYAAMAIVFSASSVAGIIASLLLRKQSHWPGPRTALIGGPISVAVGCALFAIASGPWGIEALAAGQVAIALGTVSWRITWRSYTQRTVAPGARTATFAFFSGVGKVSICLGIVAAGALGATVGTRATIVVSIAPALCAVVVASLCFTRRTSRQLTRPA